jgi:hypothetical protein
MDSDTYSEFFEKSHNELVSQPVKLILFSVSYYRLIMFSVEKLLEMSQCPKKKENKNNC